MTKRSVFASFLLAILSVCTLTGTAAHAEQWNIEDLMFQGPPNSHFIEVDQSTENTATVFSFLTTWPGSSYTRAKFCLDVSPCSSIAASSGYAFEGNFVLGKCESPLTKFCLETVSIEDDLATGPAKFVRYVVGDLPHPSSWGPYPGDEFRSSSIWEVPHLDGLESYLVTAALEIRAVGQDSKIYPRIVTQVQRFSYIKNAAETPIAEVSADGLTLFNKRSGPISIGFGSERKCAWSEFGVCGLREDFSSTTQIKLQLRLPKNQLIPYISTPIQGAQISYFVTDKNVAHLSVEGKSEWVPTIFAWVRDSEYPKTIANPPVNTNFGRWLVVSPGKIEGVRTLLKDRATAERSVWGFQTLDQYSPADKRGFEFWKSKKMRDCFAVAPGLVGSTSSNAMAYAEGPPVFDGETLRASVAGMRLKSDGVTATGRSEVQISKKFVQCLYGFRDAPIKVAVSILSDKGQPIVTTSSVTSRGDLIFIRVAGFTFSSANINLKMTQSTITIVCRNGARVSKVTGFNPKCPKGFKISN